MFCLRIGSSYESCPFYIGGGAGMKQFSWICHSMQSPANKLHSCKKNASTKSTPILRRLGLWVCPRLQLGFLSFLLSLQTLYLRLVVYISRFFRWLCQKIGKGEYLLCKVSLEVTSNVLSFSMNIFLSCFTAHWSVYIGLCRVWSLPLSNQL